MDYNIYISNRVVEEGHIDGEVFHFYKNVLLYLFHKRKDVEHYSDSIKADLYSFLHKVSESSDDLKSFVLLPQSFLSNAVLDEALGIIIEREKKRFDKARTLVDRLMEVK